MKAKVDDPMDNLVSRNIRLYRLQRGLSQTYVATRIAVTYQQLQKYETALSRITAGRLFRIARVLKVPIEAFFRKSGK